MRKARALPVDIYKNKGRDFSNNGLSSKYNEILLLNGKGHIEVDLDNPPENLCVYKEEILFGDSVYSYIEPYAEKKEGSVGYMDGGCICDTSDSRFPCPHPVRLHDRQETVAEYEMYSR